MGVSPLSRGTNRQRYATGMTVVYRDSLTVVVCIFKDNAFSQC